MHVYGVTVEVLERGREGFGAGRNEELARDAQAQRD